MRHSRFRRLTVLAVTMCLIRCGSGDQPAQQAAPVSRGRELGAHDLAANMPSHLALMLAMSWFGITSNTSVEHQGAGPDSSYGNWHVGVACMDRDTAPQSCTAAGQRDVSSRYHPLAGIYSSSGRNAESLARIDLMLSTVRRSCEQAARLDAWIIQLNGTAFTSLHTASPGSTPEISLQSLKHFQSEAAANALTGAVMPGNDSTYYWHNGKFHGLDCSTSRPTCIADLQQDVMDMVDLSNSSTASLKVGGLPVLWFYVDTASGAPTATEWGNIFNNVRAAKGDFYAIASGSPSTAFIGLFSAFDGLSPWINLGIWDGTSGSTVNAHAQAYAQRLHQNLIANVPPGKVVFGGVGPGFDDFTNGWSGPCQSRQLPRPSEAAPRNPAVLAGMIDYLKTTSIRGVILQTWDDWTEGSQLEPSVEEGPSRLVLLRQKLGELYGDAPDAAGDSALSARWQNYGQARNCGPSFKTPPQTVLCPTGGDGAIAGRVTNLQTGGAISGATVSWSGGSATSDGTGAYSLTGVTPGTVTITAQATGYLVRSYAVTVTGGSTATQDIQLSTSGKIVGTVSGNGAALGGASVRIQGGQIATDQTARTDAAGHYDQGWVPIGSYTVTCSAAGFSSQVVAPVTVATGATTTVDCALSSAGTVTGTVTNLATGGAIAGATVNYSGGSATSDSSGRYTIAGIPAGTVTLTGRATGYLARSYDVTVAGGSTTTQNIQLSTSGKIAGTVTGDGAALGGASVRIQGGQIATDQTASTDATGHYDQGWVPIGSYSVICSAAGYATKTISGVSVTSGATSTVDCPLTSRGTVTGKVTNLQTGGAIAGATVSSSGVSTTSDSAGNYTLSSLPAGTATVTATSNGYLARSYSTSVAAGGTTTQNVQLSTSGKLIGNVTHAGAALSGASVRIQGGQIPTDQTDTTDSGGHYDEGWVPIGSYTVTCSKPGFATQTLSNVTVTTGGTTTANCAL